MAKPLRVYWDACAWISYISKEMPEHDSSFAEPRYEMCKEVLKLAEEGEYEIATSSFTLAEVCKSKNVKSPANNLPAFFLHPFILLVNVDYEIGIKAQAIQVSGLASMKPADSIHLASALLSDSSVLHTFDSDLLKHDKILTNLSGEALRIVRPTEERPLPPLLEGMKND